jgi:hypothetical protein
MFEGISLQLQQSATPSMMDTFIWLTERFPNGTASPDTHTQLILKRLVGFNTGEIRKVAR